MDTVRAFYKSDAYKAIIRPEEAKLGAVGQGGYVDEYAQKA